MDTEIESIPIVMSLSSGGQPEPGSVAVKVYVVVTDGAAVGFISAGLLRLEAGLQLNVMPGDADTIISTGLSGHVLVSGVRIEANGLSIIFTDMLSRMPHVIGEDKYISTVLSPAGGVGNPVTRIETLSEPAARTTLSGAV